MENTKLQSHAGARKSYNKSRLLHFFKTILNLGCETGLMDGCLKEWSADVNGGDLLKKMLKSANPMGVYADSENGDLLDYLAQTEKKFDLFTTADVLTILAS